MLCHIKQHIGSILIIDAVKKTNATYGHIIAFVFVFFVCEGCYTAYQFSSFIFQRPSYCLPVTESFIFSGIKILVNVFIKRANIVRIIFVDLNIYKNKFLA